MPKVLYPCRFFSSPIVPILVKYNAQINDFNIILTLIVIDELSYFYN